MSRSSTCIVLALALAGNVLAAPPKPAAKPPTVRTCVPDEAAFWKDQGLTTKVATKLQFHKPLFREKVEVKVTGGAVILSGNLSSRAMIDEALRTAAGVGGVKCVQNYLQVGPPLPGTPQQQP